MVSENIRRKKAAEPTAGNERLAKLLKFIKETRFNRSLLRYIDWPLLLIVLLLSLYGVLVIFCATGTPVDDPTLTVFEKIQQQSFVYPRLQLIWVCLSVFVVAAACYLDYDLFKKWSNWIYGANIVLLFIVLGMERLRGGMAGWFQWGDGRTFQPSEVAKVAIIIALSNQFSNRKHPIRTISELLPSMLYIAVPLLLIVAQPDVGTAMVYMVVYAVLLFVSGTDKKLIGGLVCIAVLLLAAAYFVMMNSASAGFRADRIMVWLDPSFDSTGVGAGMQTQNARIAVAAGGLWGRGMFAQGNFAALNYIPDDHTDFIFAIVGETFGLVGAGVMVLLYVLLLMRLVALARKAQDAFGSYVITGVAAMMFFHIFENIGMVIGLMPVTGIPLPFVSYGGSNYLANILSIGIVLNVTMRSRARTRKQKSRVIEPARL